MFRNLFAGETAASVSTLSDPVYLTLFSIASVLIMGTILFLMCTSDHETKIGVERMDSHENRGVSRVVETEGGLLEVDEDVEVGETRKLYAESMEAPPSMFIEGSLGEPSTFSRADMGSVMMSQIDPQPKKQGGGRFFSSRRYPTLPPRRKTNKPKVVASFAEQM